jgi:hypothetical protein
MPKTAEQLEAEVAILQTQVDVLSSATFALVDAICIALDVTGTVPKEKIAQSISDLAKARRDPDDDSRTRRARFAGAFGRAHSRLRDLSD